MERTLVTGGVGFLGSHLCDSLLEEGLSETIKYFQKALNWKKKSSR